MSARALTYGSVCSGIEAASMAWKPLGWRASFVSEIEAFPSAVLQRRHPEIPLHGDFTSIQAGEYEPIDLLVGGTPCQSFSVAGLRGGLADGRGNLALEYLRLADRLRPQWLVWENVPGVLSSAGGRDFGSILGGLVELGYGFAYRVLDAQFFGVAQRRRRVFVVGHLGDWRRAAAVLFERHSLSGHPAPRRATPEGTSYSAGFGPRSGGGDPGRQADGWSEAQAFGGGGHCNPTDVATAVSAHPGGRFDLECETFIAAPLLAGGHGLNPLDENLVAHTLKGEDFDASEDGTGRGTPLIPVTHSIMPQNSGKDYKARRVEVAQPLMAGGPVSGNQGGDFVVHAIQAGALRENPDSGPDGVGVQADHAYTLEARAEVQAIPFDLAQITSAANRTRAEAGLPASTLSKTGAPHVAFNTRQYPVHGEQAQPLGAMDRGHGLLTGATVRRLTPRECERLQGFPDDYTLIPWRKGMAPDGPRYKALGNSMAVPVMAWIGRRIAMVEADQPCGRGRQAGPV